MQPDTPALTPSIRPQLKGIEDCNSTTGTAFRMKGAVPKVREISDRLDHRSQRQGQLVAILHRKRLARIFAKVGC